jgi:hypothetical protein
MNLQVTVRFADKSFPEEVHTVVDASLSVANLKGAILRKLGLGDILRINQILLLFRPQANLDLKYVSSPYSVIDTGFLLVADEQILGSFLLGHTLILIMLFQD